MSIKIQTYNVRGIRDFNKRKEIFQFIKDQKCDIALLQETHSMPMDEKLWQSQWGVNVTSAMVLEQQGE